MLSIRNQLICLSIAMLLVISFQPDQVNGQMKKKKAILKGLVGASLLKFLKPKKGGVLPIPLPLPLPLPIDWHQQAGLLSKNNPPQHVSHQPYAGQGIQMSPIEYSDYQNAISQALSNGNSYIQPYSSGSSGYSNQQTSGQENSGSSNGYDGNAGSNDDNSNNNYNSNSGSTSYGVNGVNQNDEYNAYQVSNDNNGSNGGYRAAASSLNPQQYNVHYNQQQNYGNYVPNYNQFNNAQQEYSQPAPQNNEQSQQFNYQNNQQNYQEDNSQSASSQSYIATTNQQQQSNNYIPLRSVQPIYHQMQSSNYQQSNQQQQPNYSSNGWVALD